MKIAIHASTTGFTKRWIEHCERHGIHYGLVDVLASDFMEQIRGYDALFWHASHEDARHMLVALPLMSALQSAGVRVFPSPSQLWHFDDKLAQHYFFQAHGFPTPTTTVHFDRRKALQHLENASFPLVMKLRRGSASSNVFLLQSRSKGERLIRKAFSSGFPLYNVRSRYADKLSKTRTPVQKAGILAKWAIRSVFPPPYSRQSARERGYVLLQEFVTNPGEDVRVVVVGDRAVALKRKVRFGDFRASGSGLIDFPDAALNPEFIRLAFEIASTLGARSMGIDFLKSLSGAIYVVEMSYGFPSEDFLDGASGTWSRSLEFIEEPIRLQEWMMDLVLKEMAAEAGG